MKISEIRAYLSNLAIQETDEFVIQVADGSAHAIASITRDNGSETPFPEGSPDGSPKVVVQLV